MKNVFEFSKEKCCVPFDLLKCSHTTSMTVPEELWFSEDLVIADLPTLDGFK